MKKKFEYPVQKMQGNLVLTKENEAIAYFSVPSISVAITDDEKKKKTKRDVAKVLKRLFPQKWFEIALVPKDYRLFEKMKDVESTLATESRPLGVQVLNKTVSGLTKEMEIPYQYEWVIGVPLNKNDSSLDLKKALADGFYHVSETVMEKFGYEVAVKEDWYEDWRAEEAEVYQTLSSIRAKRLSEEELYYHQRYQFLWYMPHTQEEVVANRGIENVTDTQITSKLGHLRLSTEYGQSYVDVLPIGKIPTLMNFQHIGEIVQNFNFQVGLRIKAEFTDVNGSMGVRAKMERSRTRTSNIIKEAHNTGSTQQDRIIEGKIALDDLSKKIGNKEPYVEYGMYLIVAAKTKGQLKQRRKTVLSAFQNIQIHVSRATFDTPYLFQSVLFGNKLEKTTRKWIHSSTARGLSEQILFTTTFGGTNSGFYLGRVDNVYNKWDSLSEAIQASRNIVLFNPTIANKEGIAGKVTKNPHIIMTGATGSGKSVAAQDIFFQMSLTNVKLLYVDPKKELKSHYLALCNDPIFRNKNPELVKHIESFNFVTLDVRDKKNYGVLDPIVILEPTDAIETAKSMIDYLGNGEWEMTQKTAISKAVKKIVNLRSQGEKVGFKHVIEELRKNDEKEIREAGEYLFEMIDGTILDLAFSDGSTKGLNYDDRVTILEVADLTLPKEKSTKISEHERNSIVLMFALGNFCKRFGEKNRHEETMEFFDESWILTASLEGQKVIKSMRRVGRSQNNTLVLITQSVNDAKSDDDTTGFGTILAFYEESEREQILEHVGLKVNDRNLKWIDNMSSGQCLLKDVFGNVNRISIHIFLESWLELFSPMKDTVASSIENKYARAS